MNTNTILIASFLSSMLAACGGATGMVEASPVPVQVQPDAGAGQSDSGAAVEPTEASTIDQPDADSGSMVEADVNAPEANVEASAPDAGADACSVSTCSPYDGDAGMCDPTSSHGSLFTCSDAPPCCAPASDWKGVTVPGVFCCPQ